MSTVFKYSFFPLIIALTVVSCLFMLRIMEEQNFQFIPGILSLFFAFLFMILEYLEPYRQEWNKSKGDVVSDLIRTFITLPTAAKLAEIVLPVLLFYPIKWLAAILNFQGYLEDLGFFPALIITLLICEFCYYWVHRISHRNPVLWRFHAVHHGAKRVYWLNSGRFHFVDALLGGIAYLLPILFLGVSDEVIVMIISLSAISGFMEHVNIEFRAGLLNYIFNTAELHRWHHSELEHESNNNFGKVLSIWDVLFKTFLLPMQKEVNEVGIEGEEIPVTFIGQWFYPFKKQKVKTNV